MLEVHTKKCEINDWNLLREIAVKTYTETFARYNPPEIMSAYLESAFHEKKIKEELRNPNSSFYLLYKGTQIAGYLKINEAPAQTEINDQNALEIERFYVSSAFQGEGLGGYLMKKAISIANERDKKYVWLGVWEHNEKAKRFYKKNGFYQIGQHSFFMGDDEQTDFIMRKDLKS